MQKTLSIIKPTAISGQQSGKIISMIEESGLKIIAQKMILLSQEKAQEFYGEHKDKSFFEDLVESVTTGAIIVQVLQSENAVEDYRKLMGSTNPITAEEGSIRKLFGISIKDNAVHGSADIDAANEEIAFFFNKLEICE